MLIKKAENEKKNRKKTCSRRRSKVKKEKEADERVKEEKSQKRETTTTISRLVTLHRPSRSNTATANGRRVSEAAGAFGYDVWYATPCFCPKP